ncbi:MAG: hypothetical protein SFU27_06495 [Thermonemataceae bacterium]|nr:hypothetical protein [Thermonemataceae bacterium]
MSQLNLSPFEEFFEYLTKDEVLHDLEEVIKHFVVNVMENQADYNKEFTTLFDLYLCIKKM